MEQRNQLFKVRERTSCFPSQAVFGVSAVITTDRRMHTGVKVGSHGLKDSVVWWGGGVYVWQRD